jgi:hypothetical protein
MRNKMISKNMFYTSILCLGLGISAYSINDTRNIKDNSLKSTYSTNYKDNKNIESIVNSDDLMQLANSDTTKQSTKTTTKQAVAQPIKKPTIYGGIEVNNLQKFSNAKLIGVDDASIEFYTAGNEYVGTYFAKGLLFELDNNKIINVIADNLPYYMGQRYNISYHTFKKGVQVKGSDILQMNLTRKEPFKTVINEDYSKKYDGVLVEGELIKRNK